MARRYDRARKIQEKFARCGKRLYTMRRVCDAYINGGGDGGSIFARVFRAGITARNLGGNQRFVAREQHANFQN